MTNSGVDKTEFFAPVTAVCPGGEFHMVQNARNTPPGAGIYCLKPTTPEGTYGAGRGYQVKPMPKPAVAKVELLSPALRSAS